MSSVVGAGAVAVAAAAMLGGAGVAQRRAALDVPVHATGSPRLVAALVRRRWWWIGTAASVAGLFLQVLALALGPIIVDAERDDQQHRVHRGRGAAAEPAPPSNRRMGQGRSHRARAGGAARGPRSNRGRRGRSACRFDARRRGRLLGDHAGRGRVVAAPGPARDRRAARARCRRGDGPRLRAHGGGAAQGGRQPARGRCGRATAASGPLRRARPRSVGDPAQPGGSSAGAPGGRGRAGDPRGRRPGRVGRRAVLVRRAGRARHRHPAVCDRCCSSASSSRNAAAAMLHPRHGPAPGRVVSAWRRPSRPCGARRRTRRSWR